MDNQPTKEVVRTWLQQRRTIAEPPPDIDQIRRQLGWTLAEKMQEASRLNAGCQDRRTRVSSARVPTR